MFDVAVSRRGRPTRSRCRGGDRAVFHKFYVTNSISAVTEQLPKDDCFEVLDITEQIVADLDA